MNFKKLAEQKIDELSGKKTPEKIIDKDSVELVLEGLDEDHSEKTLNEAEQDFELEFDEETVENLFDGYLGEQKDVPNPLECGPNATYRNLREGVVYKKGPDNLWETFVKDGTPGRNGQASPGGGCGVNEVNSIVNAAISNIVISGTGGSVSAVSWANITGIPTANNYTSGVLTSSDWNKFNNMVTQVYRPLQHARYICSTNGTHTSATFSAGPVSPCQQIPAKGVYKGLRVVIWNRDTTNSLNISNLWCASSPTAANLGNALVWSTVYYKGSTNFTVPPATKVGTSTTDIVPSYIVADYTPLFSIARSDTGVGTDPLLQIRSVMTSGGFAEIVSTNGQGLYRTDSNIEYAANLFNGTIATSSSFSPVSTGGLVGADFFSVLFDYANADTVTVLGLGDSTNAGIGTSSNKYTMIDGAEKYRKLNTLPLKVSVFKTAIGSTTTPFMLNTIESLGINLPDVVVIPSWTPNEGSSTYGFYTGMQGAKEAINFAKSKNIACILLTPPPNNSLITSGQQNFVDWTSQIAWVRSQSANGITVCDTASVIADETTGHYKPGLNNADGLNPNSSGVDAEGVVMYNSIVAAVANRNLVL